MESTAATDGLVKLGQLGLPVLVGLCLLVSFVITILLVRLLYRIWGNTNAMHDKAMSVADAMTRGLHENTSATKDSAAAIIKLIGDSREFRLEEADRDKQRHEELMAAIRGRDLFTEAPRENGLPWHPHRSVEESGS